MDDEVLAQISNYGFHSLIVSYDLLDILNCLFYKREEKIGKKKTLQQLLQLVFSHLYPFFAVLKA